MMGGMTKQIPSKRWSVTGVFDGWRIDTSEVVASSLGAAKRKFRSRYNTPRKVTSVHAFSVS